MFDLLVNAEGGLTTAGYVVTISVGIVLFLAAVFSRERDLSVKK